MGQRDKFESKWITGSKIKLFLKFRKSEIFQDFQERLLFFLISFGRAYLFPHLYQITRQKLG